MKLLHVQGSERRWNRPPSARQPTSTLVSGLLKLLLPLALGGIATVSVADQASNAAYDSLPPAKATAAVPGHEETLIATVHGQAHDLAAAMGALEACKSQSDKPQPCELVRLNGERITTGREIRAQVPRDPHPLYLWEYRQGASTVYLAGSIHVLKPSLYPLPSQVTTAFQQSDYLVLEVNTQQYSPDVLQQQTMKFALLPAGQTLQSVLPEPLARRLDDRLAAYGMSLQTLAAAKPAMVMNQLVIARLMAMGYLPDYGVERHFLSLRTNQQILELESLDAQLRLLFDQPAATQVQLLADTLDMELEIAPLLADMLVAWLSGDDARFLELFKAQSGTSALAEAFNRSLLDDRNLVMADKIRGYLNEPGSYFVLVGAAHLIGDKGIVALLSGDGIDGRRITSSDRL